MLDVPATFGPQPAKEALLGAAWIKRVSEIVGSASFCAACGSGCDAVFTNVSFRNFLATQIFRSRHFGDAFLRLRALLYTAYYCVPMTFVSLRARLHNKNEASQTSVTLAHRFVEKSVTKSA